MFINQLLLITLISLTQNHGESSTIPMIITTWKFFDAAQKAWEYVSNHTAIDTIEEGCTTCEKLQCDFTVGYGGSPDENGETTLDAMIFDGATINMGAVAGLREVKKASSVARYVLDHTDHSILVGSLATKFAVMMGFVQEPLNTTNSSQVWEDWMTNKCQPNFWKNVIPDPKQNCGPYNPILDDSDYYDDIWVKFSQSNHDTIGMIAIDADNNIAAGTSSNGATHKIPGRVGDAPIPGAGAYADNDAGAAVATGDGDVMMRFLPSFLAVEEMRRGSSPTNAASLAINRIALKYSSFAGAVIAVNRQGQYGAACNGMETFPFLVANNELGQVTLQNVTCTNVPI